MLRTIIAEDEPLARERIRSLLNAEADIELVAEAADGRSAVAAIEEHAPDLLFLDINMPELDGFGVLSEIGLDAVPAVVFVTAFDQFAVQAFEAHALDYLLKPFDEDRFRDALARARLAVRSRAAGDLDRRLTHLLEDLGRPAWLERVAVKAGGRIIFLRTDQIEWIGAEGNYARLHIGGNRSWLLRETMNRLEERLDPRRFLRIHRSTIVNTDAITELEPLFQGDFVVILRGGDRITSSRGYRANLQNFLDRTL